MKCVSLHQPWAHAVLHLGKTVENRTWATRHRGPLLIHAARSLVSLDAQNPTYWRRVLGVELPDRGKLTFGAILGVVDVVACVKVGPGGDLGEFGASKWAEDGFYAWVLENPRPFTAPIEYRGAQQLFDVADDLLPPEFRTAAA